MACWTSSSHLLVVGALAVPMILLYSFGLPLASFRKLYTHSHSIKELLHAAKEHAKDPDKASNSFQFSPEVELMRHRFGFLFLGFAENFYFWESIIYTIESTLQRQSSY